MLVRLLTCAAGALNIKSNVTVRMKVYEFIRAHGGFDNWQVILVELFPCSTKDELLARERHFIELLGATLNCHMPGRTKREWYATTYKETHKENARKFYEENKAELSARARVWYEEHKQEHQEKCKQYYEIHKDEIRAKNKQWDINHKEEIRAHRRVKMTCECGKTFNAVKRIEHEKSQRHLKHLQSILTPMIPQAQLVAIYLGVNEPVSLV